MLKIGFCDDDLSILKELQVLLDHYRVEKNRELAYTAYQSPLELLADMEKGLRFDILFLDVLMPGQTGMEAAREIREFDTAVKIIFLTSSAEFAVESYTVGAYFYQLELLPVDGFSDCRVQKGGTAESDHALQDRNHTDRTGKTDLLRGYGPDTVVLYGGWPDTGTSGKVGRFGGTAGHI